jgi:hypothetical protein
MQIGATDGKSECILVNPAYGHDFSFGPVFQKSADASGVARPEGERWLARRRPGEYGGEGEQRAH